MAKMKIEREKKKLENLVSEDTWEALKECNAIIAGGALTSIFTNKDVNDVDVYFRKFSDFILFVQLCFTGNETDLRPKAITSKSVMFVDNGTGKEIQLIGYQFFPTPTAIFDSYDFTINMAAYDCKSEKFYFDQDFMKHNSQRHLSFNPGTSFPIVSALRVKKYEDRGYKTTKAQFLRLGLTIANLQIDSWETLKKHIGGLYNLSVDELFDETKPFDLNTAIARLDEVVADEEFELDPNPPALKDIIENYKDQLATLDLKDPKGRYFKYVKLESPGSYASNYRNAFKYKLNEVANGGPRGLWCYEGTDVIAGKYSHGNNSVMIELQPLGEVENNGWANEVILKGDVRVVKEYSLREWIREFRAFELPKEEPKAEEPEIPEEIPDEDDEGKGYFITIRN